MNRYKFSFIKFFYTFDKKALKFIKKHLLLSSLVIIFIFISWVYITLVCGINNIYFYIAALLGAFSPLTPVDKLKKREHNYGYLIEKYCYFGFISIGMLSYVISVYTFIVIKIN
ncbi:hypothetical protein KDD93_02320 [Campylobacter sp. faydin G-24]|uniref:Uncharacterized protein n=1 Tax=Campylobacter anatolicus TaxID=2829105 RepID=A0ABS5HGK3_9BACT|nr:hypothetical protein [Campylobacter anatolicus]MBR8463405.1 hypothetical protein [Campylobacter anatolicus]